MYNCFEDYRMKYKHKYFPALSLYRFMICIAIFILFVAMVTLFIHNGIKHKRYEVGLKMSVNILSEALLFVNFLPGIEDVKNDAYYLYMLDVLNSRFKSINYAKSKKIICKGKPYKTYNGKALMSDLLFDTGARIYIGNIFFMVNKPITPTEPLLVLVDTNGVNVEPNRLGYDVFVFQIIHAKLKAMGNKGTLYPIDKYSFYCDSRSISKDRLLGANCTYEALTNPKYFSKLK